MLRIHYQKLKSTCRLITTLLFILLSSNAQSQASLTPILFLLLSDGDVVSVQIGWNTQSFSTQNPPQLNVAEGSINTLTFDRTSLPAEMVENLLSLNIILKGECYQLGGETLDPDIFEWNIISTGDGKCEISLSFEAEIDGIIETRTAKIGVDMIENTPPPTSINVLVAGADISDGDAAVSGIFSISNVEKWVAPVTALSERTLQTSKAASIFPDNHTPSMYEFDAMHKGVALEGVMLSTRKISDPRNISDFSMSARTSVRFVQDIPVLVGSGVVDGGSDSSDETFAFIAVAAGVDLPGPAVGEEFHLDGKNKLNVLCVDQRLAGFGKLSVKRTGTRIASSLVGFTNKDCTNEGGRFKGTAGVFSDFQVINTHLGKIMRGRGTAHPLHNGKITTVEDMDMNDPDYALYMLGVPERLSSLHAIQPLDDGTQLSTNVFVLDPFTLAKIAKIRRENGTMIFSEAPEQLSGISVGDIIVGKPTTRLRDGLLREVTAKGTSNGLLYLHTKPAVLQQLFVAGGFELDRNLTLGDIEQEITPQYFNTAGVQSLREGQPQNMSTGSQTTFNAAREIFDNDNVSHATLDILPFPSTDLGHVFYDRDGNLNTKNDQFRTEGLFELDASITAQFKCRGAFCSKPYILLTFGFEEEFELSGHVFTDDFELLSESAVLKSLKFDGFWAGIIKIKPQIDLKVQIEGTTDTDAQFGIDQHFYTTQGLELEDGDWTKIKEKDQGFAASPTPNYQPNDGTINLRARAALEGSAKLSGIRIGGVDIGIYTDLDAATPRDPLWEITAGINSEAYIDVNLLLTSITGGPWELFDISLDGLTGGQAPELPLTIDKITVDGVKVENGAAALNSQTQINSGFSASQNDPLIFKVKASDPQTGADCCTVRLSSNIDGTIDTLDATENMNNGTYKFSVESLSSGTHVMTAKVYKTGDHISTAIEEDFTVKVVAQLPLIAGNHCDDIDLDFVGASGAVQTIDEGQLIRVNATLNGCLSDTIVKTVYFEGFPLISLTGDTTSGQNLVPQSRTFNDAGSYRLTAYTVDYDGNQTDSNVLTVIVQAPQLELVFDEPVLAFSTNGGNYLFGLSEQSTAARREETQPPLLAPGDSEPRRLGLDNWAVGESAFFRNPGDGYLKYELEEWTITDPSAAITTNANGHAKIIPATPGWHRISVILRNVDTLKEFKKSEVFYVAPNSDKTWRGYMQDDFDEDASHMMSGMLGTSPI